MSIIVAPAGNAYVGREVEKIILQHGYGLDRDALKRVNIQTPAGVMDHSFRWLVERDYCARRRQHDRATII